MGNTLKEWAERVYLLAKEKGWHDPAQEGEARFIERACNNLHDEVSELHEAWRNNRLLSPCDKAVQMKKLGIEPLTNLEEELADIVIRVFDDAETLGVNIQLAVERKHRFNASRPWRHGGKKS